MFSHAHNQYYSESYTDHIKNKEVNFSELSDNILHVKVDFYFPESKYWCSKRFLHRLQGYIDYKKA